MKNGIIIITAIASVGFVASILAGWAMGLYGQRRGGWHHMGRGTRVGFGYERNLTHEQQQALDVGHMTVLHFSNRRECI